MYSNLLDLFKSQDEKNIILGCYIWSGLNSNEKKEVFYFFKGDFFVDIKTPILCEVKLKGYAMDLIIEILDRMTYWVIQTGNCDNFYSEMLDPDILFYTDGYYYHMNSESYYYPDDEFYWDYDLECYQQEDKLNGVKTKY